MSNSVTHSYVNLDLYKFGSHIRCNLTILFSDVSNFELLSIFANSSPNFFINKLGFVHFFSFVFFIKRRSIFHFQICAWTPLHLDTQRFANIKTTGWRGISLKFWSWSMMKNVWGYNQKLKCYIWNIVFEILKGSYLWKFHPNHKIIQNLNCEHHSLYLRILIIS